MYCCATLDVDSCTGAPLWRGNRAQVAGDARTAQSNPRTDARIGQCAERRAHWSCASPRNLPRTGAGPSARKDARTAPRILARTGSAPVRATCSASRGMRSAHLAPGARTGARIWPCAPTDAQVGHCASTDAQAASCAPADLQIYMSRKRPGNAAQAPQRCENGAAICLHLSEPIFPPWNKKDRSGGWVFLGGFRGFKCNLACGKHSKT